MPTECSADLFGFAPVEARCNRRRNDFGRRCTAFAGGGSCDQADGAADRVCFHDVRREDLIEHEVVTLVGPAVFGIALGYEDLNDHDELRHDPVMAVLAGS